MQSNLLSLQRAIKIFTIICLSYGSAWAQDHEFGSWAGWFNNVRFSEHWGMNNDIQFRAGKDWNEQSMLLVRPGVNYYVKAGHTASAGYAASITTNNLQTGQQRVAEHRIWEQYIIAGRLFKIPVQHRLRLEQRFLQRPEETVFAQRARYFLRGIIPLQVPLSTPFTNGMFVSLQNELFFHIQNKAELNGSFFDQNRAYASLGFRFSEKYDLEAGYMNQYLKNTTGAPGKMTHIFQLAFYTRL